MAWGALRWLKRKKKKLSEWDKKAIWSLALGGPVLHLAMDGMNNYGIHPLWPLWGGWVFGDTLFIIEPLLWLALFPVVYFSTNRRAFRWAAETILVALFTAVWILPITRWYSALAIGLFGVAMWLATRKAKPRLRADLCSIVAISVLLVFTVCGAYARRVVHAANLELHPTAELHDVVLTPFPSNPFCWNIVTVETFAEGSRYRLRRGRFSPWPRWVAAAQCPRFPTQGATALLTPVPDLWGAEFDWEGQYVAAVGDLQDYVDYSCTWAAFLKFSRAPFLQEEGQSIWAGDLRFDYGPDLGFAEMEVSESEPPCPRTPGWIPPRASEFYKAAGLPNSP
jgi:inner membrane protein